MAILNKGQTFSDGEQVTSTKLNTLVDGSTFASGAVDDVSTQLSGGAIIVKDGGVTPAKLSTDILNWDSNAIIIESNNTGDCILRLNADSGLDACYLNFGDNADGDVGQIAYIHNSDYMRFKTQDVERARIDNNGTLLIGTTDQNPYDNTGNNPGIALHGNGSTQAGLITASRYQNTSGVFNRTGSNGTVVGFRREGTAVGAISVTTSSTAYNTSSDYRLKEDVIEMEGSLARLKALKPCNFRWISDGARVDGFLAHEAQEVVPEAVTGTKDAVDDEGNPDYQGIDQSKLVPLLTKALQEAVAKIEALEARVLALES